MKKNIFVIGFILFFFVLSSIIPVTVGFNTKSSNEEFNAGKYNYDNYSLSETYYKEQQTLEEYSNSDNIFESENKYDTGGSTQASGGPADSAWPMICHDLRHTGRSPYSPDNSGIEKWRYRTKDCIEASPVIGEDGTIYVGDLDFLFYAINPDGTVKWKYGVGGWIFLSAPAVAEDGTVYVTSWDDFLHAVNPNGTRKWKFCARASICSSPAISEDGTIYFGSLWSLGSGGKIHAVNPNGTEKWRYKTGDHIMSYPAIGEDGTIYIGSSDNFLYAMNPNGILKWRYKTGNEIQGHPSIADDGTIYVPSFDDYLHALYPNGTLRWKAKLSAGSDSGVAIAQDGTLYIGSDKLYAIFPNGTMKWSVNLGSFMDDSSPAISADGNIYICAGQSLVAVDSNGSELWRKKLGKLRGSPAIGKDGTIYVGSGQDGFGYLHAFGAPCFTAEAHGPYYGLTGEPVQFEGDAYKGVKSYSWHWDFGDGHTSDEQNPSHIYTNPSNFTVILTVSDSEGNVTDDTTWAWVQDGNVPPDKPTIDGPKKGLPHQHYTYSFVSSDPEENPIWYYVDWDDGKNTGWLGPYSSGHKITITHTWHEEKVFIIRAKAKDVFDNESEWATFKVNLPRDKAANYFFFSLIERFPLFKQLFSFQFKFN
jgi:outer membrane protein assembly factor BamB